MLQPLDSFESSKCSLKQLKEIASKVNAYMSRCIAEEITRMQLELFLLIEVSYNGINAPGHHYGTN